MPQQQTSPKGIELLKILEGFRSKPYLCAAGVPTIGYGATFYEDGRKVTLKDAPVTEEQATRLLGHQLTLFEHAVARYIEQPLQPHQFDALVLFCFNIGIAAFQRSTLRKKVNADPADPAIREEFLKWVYAGGKKSKGLRDRRLKEADLYFSSSL